MTVVPWTSLPGPTNRQPSESQYAGAPLPTANDGVPQPSRRVEPPETSEMDANGRWVVVRPATSTPSPKVAAVVAVRNAGAVTRSPLGVTKALPSR